MNRIKKISIIITAIILIISISLAIFIDYFYSHKIEQIIRNEITRQVTSKIDIAKIDISIFHRFPNVTIILNNVTAYNTNAFYKIKHDGKIFFFRKIYFQFNLFDFLNERYIVHSVHADNGYFDILVNENGDINYDIIAPGNANSSEVLKIDLQAIKITNTDLYFYNPLKNVKIVASTNKTNLKVFIVNDNFEAKVDGIFFIKNVRYNNLTLIHSKALNLKANIVSDNVNINVLSSEILFSGATFEMKGIIPLYQNKPINLELESKKIDIITLLSLLPTAYTKDISDYKSSGILIFKTYINGSISTSISPAIKVFFGIKNGQVSNEKLKINIKNLNTQGFFSNGFEHNSLSSYIQLKEFNANFNKGQINGYFELKNFNNPQITFKGSADINLSEFEELLKLKNVSHLSGKISGQLDIKFLLDLDDSLNIKKINQLYSSGYARLDNITLKINNNLYFSDISGNISFDDKILLNNININVNDNKLLLSGRINNSFIELSKNQPYISFSGNIKSTRFNADNLDQIILPIENTPNTNQFRLPERIAFNLAINFDSIIYKTFRAGKLNCNISYIPSYINIDNLEFNIGSGTIKNKLNIIYTKRNIFNIAGESNFRDVDICTLMESFDNFGQKTILSENIKGIVSGDLKIYSEWNENLEPVIEHLKAECALKIEKGELINFEPMKNLSKFIEVSELEHIKFSTLSNTFYISDGALQFPQMDIISSAINIQASGIHRFDNNFTYHVKVYLSDILSKKTKNHKKEFEEFEDKKFGRIIIPLLITGNFENYKVSYDRKEALKLFNENFEKEKITIKQNLQNEINSLKNPYTPDTSITGFKIEWEETIDTTDFPVKNNENNNKPKQEKENTTKVKSEGFKIKFDDDN
jgi:hypothetical protein